MRILAVAVFIVGSLFTLPAAAVLTVTPITWNIVGLDSNTPATGPQYFPVGARVCSDQATTGVTSAFVWDSTNANINNRSGSLTALTLGNIAAGACVDAYYEVEVNRIAAAFDTTRRYHITATDTSGTFSTPTPRELYVEHLISQSRNGVDGVLLNGVSIPAGGAMNLVIGNTYTITLNAHTATQGYEQFEAFINFPNTIFQILSVSTTYSANTSPLVSSPNSKLYADACGWDNDPTSPSYRACLGSGKSGGTVTTVYQVKIVATSASSNNTINSLLYDFSGSSFHYNADFSAGARIVNILDPTGATITKGFNPGSTVVGGVSTLTITLGNTNAGLVAGYNFTDPLPAGMAVANPPNASTSGCGTPTFAPTAGATSLSFSNGSIAGLGSCTIRVSVTASGTGTYNNTTSHLFVGTTDTTKFATASLTVSSAPAPPACIAGMEAARWTMETGAGTSTPPVYSSKASNVSAASATFTASAIAGSAETIDTANGNPVNSWSGTGWGGTNATPDSTRTPYFEFVLDTSNFSGGPITMTFDANPLKNGDWGSPNNNLMFVYGRANSGAFSTLANGVQVTRDTFSTFAYAIAAGSATTTFRINITGANKDAAKLLLDNIAFTGCGIPVGPTITKTFSPNPITVNGTSTLTFALTNTNNVPLGGLTGVTVTDTLPSGVQVAATPAASTTCGGTPTWAPGAGTTVLTFGSPTGGTIPARSGVTNGACTVQVDVTATTAGPHNNVSGYISSTQTGQNTGTGGSAAATLTAVLPPVIAKNFSPDSIVQNGVSTLTFTVTNPNLSNAIGGVVFSDTFPTSPGQMRVAATPGATTSGCGAPTFAPAANATSISFTGGSIAAGGTCTVTVNVTAPALGTYSNTSGNVSHVINAATVNGNTATDSLAVTVTHPAVQLLKQIGTIVTGPWSSFIAIAAGTNVFYQFTVENAGDVQINLAAGFLTDPDVSPAGCTWRNGSGTIVGLPATLPVAVGGNNNHIITCVVGPIVSASGTHTNTASATATLGGVSCGTPCTDTSSATYQTGVITIAKRAVQSSFAAVGDIINYEYTVTNGGAALAGPSVAVTDNKVAVTCPSISSVYGTTYLAASQTLLCEAAYTVTAGDVTAGSVANIANATAGGLAAGPANISVPLNAGVTRAVVSGMSAYVDGGQSWIEWETTSEIGTAGFNVYRHDGPGGWVKLNDRLLPSLIGHVQGGVYRISDPGFAVGARVTYRLEEIEATGGLRRFPPATLTVGSGRPAPSGAVMLSTAGATIAVPGYDQAARAPNGRVSQEVRAGKVQKLAAAAASATGSAIRILVDEEGLYTVTADQVATALGANRNQAKQWIAKTQLRLQQKGQAVAWMADPANDRLYFYGQALQGTDAVYAQSNVYWLDRGAGQAMSIVSGPAPAPASGLQPFVSRVHAEENNHANPFVANDPDADFWFWNYVTPSPEPRTVVPFAAKAPDVVHTGMATLHAYLQGATDLAPGNDHHAHVLVNGTEVGAVAWDGINPKVLSATFDASLLLPDGNNTIGVAGEPVAGYPGFFWVQGFDIDYPRAYQAVSDELRLRGAGNPVVTIGGFGGPAIAVLDISNPRAPKWVAAKTVTTSSALSAVSFAPATPSTDYFAAIAKAPAEVAGYTPSTTLRSTSNAATYVVITPAELRAGADSLAAYRGGKVVELKAIYDEFSYGISNPYAIRSFMAWTTQNWRTKPRHVAFVGKGTFDHKDYLGYGTNRFPVLMGATPDGLAAADNRYADFDNDGIPDIAVGRIPALTNADVTDYVAKLKSYDARGRRPANQALLLADNPDDAGPFTANNQAVARALQARGYATIPIELETTPAHVAEAQMLGLLNSAPGVGLFNFIGHGGTNQLADEALLLNDPGSENVSQLTNGAKLPLFLGFTCAVGDGSYPGYDSLAESLLWRQGGGAVASFVPTALMLNGQSHMLNLSLIDTLVGSNARPSLGEAATAALRDFAAKGGPRYMLETYSVVGDPALRVQQ